MYIISHVPLNIHNTSGILEFEVVRAYCPNTRMRWVKIPEVSQPAFTIMASELFTILHYTCISLSVDKVFVQYAKYYQHCQCSFIIDTICNM